MGQPIEKELQQSKPFPSLEQEVLVNLARTHAVLTHKWESELKPFGLTVTQFNVLRILRGAGKAGLCQHQIRDRLVAQVPDVPRLLRRLEDAVMIRQQRSETDRREVIVFITRAGLQALAKLDKVLDHFPRELLGHMSQAQLRKLNDLLVEAR